VNPFIPEKLPLDDLDWARLAPLIGQADCQPALFEGVTHPQLARHKTSYLSCKGDLCDISVAQNPSHLAMASGFVTNHDR
jgi:hypothetical protein